MLTRLSIILAFVLSSTFANAQDATAPDPVQSDLDGDGQAETFLLLYPAPSVTHLLISPVNKPTLLAQNIVWRGGLGQEPSLSVAPNGNLRISSGNQAIGRNRWLLIKTVDYRDGAYKVVGLTYNWFDTADLNNGGTCDLNLITGQGIRRLAGRGQEAYFVDDIPSPNVVDWREDSLFRSDSPLPDMCGDI